MKQISCKNKSGYTIIELLIVIGIIALGTLIATPDIIDWMRNNRIKGVTRDLISNFQRARMAAVKQNTRAVLSFTIAGAVSNGSYTLFIDDGAGVGGVANDFIRNGTEQYLVAAGQDNVVGTITMPASVQLIAAVFSGPTNQCGFNAQGLPAGSRIGTVTFQKTDDNNRQFQVIFSIAGNVRTQFTTDNGVTWK